jgi:hypothetical protein
MIDIEGVGEAAIQLRWRRSISLAALSALLGACVLAGLVMIRDASNAGVLAFGALCVASFGIAAVGYTLRLGERRPILVASSAGLIDPTGIFKVGSLDWSMVSIVRRPSTAILGLGRLQIVLSPDFRRTPSLTIRDRVLLFLRSGSTSRSINLATGAVKGPPDWIGRLVEMSASGGSGSQGSAL